MKFVVDAQLPPRLAKHLVSLGHDAVHVAALPDGESQPDPEIAAYADAEGFGRASRPHSAPTTQITP